MNVREATAADEPTLLDFTSAIWAENWDRPWPPPELTPALFEGKLVLLAEDEGEPVGYAFGELDPHGYAHVNIVYVVPERRRQGVTKALLAAFGERAREQGIEHLTLDVATRNEVGREAWRRLGFTEWAQRLTVPIERIAHHDEDDGESYASLHVQTDDSRHVRAQVDKYLPRLGGSDEPRVSGRATAGSRSTPSCVDRDRKARERLASELSNATAAVVCAIASTTAWSSATSLFERGSIVDEYQSLPEHLGAAPARRRGRPRREPDRRLAADRRRAGAGPRGRAHRLRRRTSSRPRPSSCSSSPRCSASRAPGAGRSQLRAHALHRRPLPVRGPRADRARREGNRLRGGRDRPRRPAGLDLREERDRPRARLRGGRGPRAAGVRGDHGVPRGALPGAGAVAGRPGRARARAGCGCSASTTGSATPTTRRGGVDGAREELDARLADLDRARSRHSRT